MSAPSTAFKTLDGHSFGSTPLLKTIAKLLRKSYRCLTLIDVDLEMPHVSAMESAQLCHGRRTRPEQACSSTLSESASTMNEIILDVEYDHDLRASYHFEITCAAIALRLWLSGPNMVRQVHTQGGDQET